MADWRDLEDDDFLLAGEMALGVLEGEERARAQRKQLADANFAAAVEWWNMRIGALAEAAGEFSPPRDILRAIHARLDAEETGGAAPVANIDPAARKPSPWSFGFAATGLASAAAALALFLATPQAVDQVPTQQSPEASERFVAQAADDEAGRRLAGLVDPQAGRLSITVTGLEAEQGRVAELWVVPSGGAPRSLGFLPAEGNLSRQLTQAETGLLIEGAALAVTFEEDSGVPHDTPTLPIVLVGALDKV